MLFRGSEEWGLEPSSRPGGLVVCHFALPRVGGVGSRTLLAIRGPSCLCFRPFRRSGEWGSEPSPRPGGLLLAPSNSCEVQGVGSRTLLVTWGSCFLRFVFGAIAIVARSGEQNPPREPVGGLYTPLVVLLAACISFSLPCRQGYIPSCSLLVGVYTLSINLFFLRLRHVGENSKGEKHGTKTWKVGSISWWVGHPSADVHGFITLLGRRMGIMEEDNGNHRTEWRIRGFKDEDGGWRMF